MSACNRCHWLKIKQCDKAFSGHTETIQGKAIVYGIINCEFFQYSGEVKERDDEKKT